MIPARRRMPDFAGVALVDILANGVAMLIIVIVLSIATRAEREQRYAEQTDEVASVMSHRFSTSLVLNSLAASPPATLHDYETSPLDQVLDPEVLPILELHRGFVREFYTGAVWTRHALLAGENAMGAWLSGFSDLQRERIRVDVYDVDQFYVAMAILREHGIVSRHWHFTPGRVSLAEAGRCPPGVAAKDCLGVAREDAPVEWPETVLADRRAPGGLGGPDRPSTALGEGRSPGGTGEPDWPPAALGQGQGPDGSIGSGAVPGPMPGGVVPGTAGLAGGGSGTGGAGGPPEGSGAGGPPDAARRGTGFGSGQGAGPEPAAGLGSFPDARAGGTNRSAGRGGGGRPRSGNGRGEGDGNGGGAQVRFRIALPESVRRELDRATRFSETPELETMLGVMLSWLGELQATLDAGGSPSRQIAGFARRFQLALRFPPPLTEAEREVARALARDFVLMHLLDGPASRLEPLAVRPFPLGPGEDTALIVEPNRLIEEVGLGRGPVADGAAAGGGLPEVARPRLALNAYPGIWKGLEIAVEPYSVLLVPPAAHAPGPLRWRAAGYLAPTLDDFIFGFVFAGVDAEGRLQAQADANRVRLGGQALFTGYRTAPFGARGWLVSLYAALAAGILLLVLNRRLLTGRAA